VETTRGRRTTAAALAAFLAAAFLPLIARAGAASPNVPAPDSPTALFVGNYGESFTFDSSKFAVSAQMHGRIEDVRLYPKNLHPTDADYVPKNFQALGLRELLVIPKDLQGGFSRLMMLVFVKRKAFAADSKINFQEFRPPEGGSQWPPNTTEFAVSFKSGPRVWQLYSQSHDQFFIWTTGFDPGQGADAPLQSLDGFLMRIWSAPQPGETADTLRFFLSQVPPVVFAAGLIAEAAFLLIAFAPLGFLDRRRKILGLSLFGFSNGLAVYAFLVCLTQTYLPSVRIFPSFEIIDITGFILAGGACWLLARKLRASNVTITMILSLAPITYMIYEMWLEFLSEKTPLTLSDWIGWTFLGPALMYVFGAVIGLVFGLAVRPELNEKEQENG